MDVLVKIFFLVLITFSPAFCMPGKGASGILENEKTPPKKIREFRITENDTLTYTLKLALDKRGRPLYFFRNIFTPVCYTNECKPVYVNFYWDLLGNYTHYELPPGKILTKVDHDEFEQKDYDKLQEIIVKPTSIFADLKMEDLITSGTDNLSDSVDAKTGATLKTIKNEVIDGAVYTCFTLWHIAHGKVVPEMQKITESYKNSALLHSFLNSSNHHYQYWAMDRVISSEGNAEKAYLEDILKLIRRDNVFTAKYALQKLAGKHFADEQTQDWLWETYQKSNYTLQMAILKKMKEIPVGEKLASGLALNLLKSNREQFTGMLSILKAQPRLPEPVLNQISTRLLEAETDDAQEIYIVLEQFNPQDKETIARIQQYKTSVN
jgi:hypothetical protein